MALNKGSSLPFLLSLSVMKIFTSFICYHRLSLPSVRFVRTYEPVCQVCKTNFSTLVTVFFFWSIMQVLCGIMWLLYNTLEVCFSRFSDSVCARVCDLCVLSHLPDVQLRASQQPHWLHWEAPHREGAAQTRGASTTLIPVWVSWG